jgi:protocatechuate 3,4-dioxygenase beta subunit
MTKPPRETRLSRIFVMLLVILAFTGAAPAQNRPAYGAVPGQYTIAGVLLNALTGEPLQRATVEALKESDSHAMAACVTDSEGRFTLEHLATAKYQLTASRRGFRTAFYDEHDEYSTAIVTGPDQDTTHLQFRLMPQATLRGVVTSEDGDPVANARVMLFRRPQHPLAGERTGIGDATVTDDTGAYEFSNLSAGEYMLAVVGEPWYALHEGAPATRNPALDVAYPVTYFDSATDESAATPIVVAGGSRLEANISLHAVPALHITLSVPQKADDTLAPPTLEQTIFGTVVPTQSGGLVNALQPGSMEMNGIAPGHYQLTQGDPPHTLDLDLTAAQQIDPNAGTAAHPLAGRLQMLSGAPPPDDAMVSLQRVDNNPGQFQFAAPATRGRFSFDAVSPGDWEVAVTSGASLRPVIAVALGAARHPGSRITLREGTGNLVVTISDSASDVKGFATKDGKGMAGVMIVLLPKNPAQWRALTRRDQSDSDGSFALHNVAPGDYGLVAIEDGWPLDWTSPDAMARYLPAASNVRVTESSGQVVQLSAPVAVQQR